MNEIWSDRIKNSVRLARQRPESGRKHIVLKVFAGLLLLHFLFPQHLKRLIYPYLFGGAMKQEQQISAEDFFEDVESVPFHFQRNGTDYILVPKVKYQVTGRIGIVDRYDSWWGKFYRGHSQGKYINLVPQDIFLVIGQMAEPKIFDLFDFEHEERMGSVLCKGVKYRKSFMSSFYTSDKERKDSEQNLAKCEPYINIKEYNNYHPIPATERINMAMRMLLYGDVVTLEGILVDVPVMGLSTGTRKEQVHEKFKIGGHNPGKCFILYTTKIVVNGVVYE